MSERRARASGPRRRQRCPDFGRPTIDTFTAIGDTLFLHDTVGDITLELTRVP